jgi:hypothetical protein
VSADAESTDAGESIKWQTPTTKIAGQYEFPLTIIPNDEPYDGSSPVGNGCSTGPSPSQFGAGLTQPDPSDVTCAVPAGVSIGLKTGTAMVWAPQTPTLTVTMVGTGLEAIAFGLLLS